MHFPPLPLADESKLEDCTATITWQTDPFGQLESASRRWGESFRRKLVCNVLTRLHRRKCALLFVIFRCRRRNEYWVGRKSSRLTLPDSWMAVPKSHGQAVSAVI